MTALPGHREEVEYYRWRTEALDVAGGRVAFATKPGVRFFGGEDVPARLLAEYVDVSGAARVIDLNCGAGIVGAAVALRAPAASVAMLDRNIVAVEAARRTLQINTIGNAVVHFAGGIGDLLAARAADVVCIRLPKGKLPMLRMIYDAFGVLAVGGRCYLAGATDEGIKPAVGRLEQLFGNVTVLRQEKGCRVVVATKTTGAAADAGALAAELAAGAFHQFSAEVRGMALEVWSRPGVFAWDRLDEGTRLLIEQMEIGADAAVLDLGCGNGVVGVAAAKLATGGHVHLVDADFDAIESAKETVRVNAVGNCTVLAGDVGEPVRERKFDVIVTNPPFHVGHGAELDVAGQFIREAALMLKGGGSLFLVANRTLPYEKVITRYFGKIDRVFADRRYKVLRAWGGSGG